jgi:hypothetical protein
MIPDRFGLTIAMMVYMIGLRGKNNQIGKVIISAIAVLMMYHVASEKLKVLVYDSPCKPLSLPPGMIARVLQSCKIASLRAIMFKTIPPSCSKHLRGLAAKVAFILDSCRSSFPLTRINSLLPQYLPNVLPCHSSNKSDLSAGQMLDSVKHYYILWFKSSFLLPHFNTLPLVYNGLRDIYYNHYSLSRVSLRNRRLLNNYYHTLIRWTLRSEHTASVGQGLCQALRLFREPRAGGEQFLDEALGR